MSDRNLSAFGADYLARYRDAQAEDALEHIPQTHARIYTVVLPCHVCERPHDIVVALVTRSEQLSPECRFTLPAACVSCGANLATSEHDDDVRDTVSAMIWAQHHGVFGRGLPS